MTLYALSPCCRVSNDMTRTDSHADRRAGVNAWRALAASVLAATLLAACASSGPAPVSNRASVTHLESAAPSASPAVVVGPGQYRVKKGDTLYGISLDHGQSYRDLAAWNALSDPNHIQVGQLLRVIPPGGESAALPEGGAVAQPVNLGSEPEMAATTHVTTTPSAEVATLKTGPKGGKRAYTPTALAELLAEEAAAASTTAVVVAPPIKPVTAVASPAVAATSVAKPALASGDVQWDWPASGRIIDAYAEGRNKGIDLAGKIGDPVLAAANGKVILVSNALRGYGNFVIVKHNNLFLSVYAHNSRILVKEEQTVSKGQKIAEIGSSDTDQPKLHFEIRRQGQPVDPAKYLPAR